MLAIGENSLDRVCELTEPPPAGGKTAIAAYRELPGGQIATAALACARLELRVGYVGAIGDDRDGERALAPLRDAGVDLAGVVRVAGAPTRLALVLVDRASGERTVLSYRDRRLALSPQQLDRAAVASARGVLIDAVDPEVSLWVARVAREAGTAVVLDADALGPQVLRILEEVDFPIVSREFAEAVSKDGSARSALRELGAPRARLLVVTLGAEGALARSGDRVIESPGFRVAVRDTTGAGDVFRAGFLSSALRGADAESALRAANAAAAMSCRAPGAQGGAPTRAELDAFLREREGA